METVSTLMDGEFNVDEAEREIARLKSDLVSREHWDTYHLIGEVMRGGATGTPGFSARFGERLALEPTVLAPRPRTARGSSRTLQRFVMPAMASAAAIAVVGWMFVGTAPTPDVAGGRVAVAPVPLPVAQPLVAVKPDASQPLLQEAVSSEPVQDYMLAHQGISPTTAIQGVAPYIRTVSGSGE